MLFTTLSPHVTSQIVLLLGCIGNYLEWVEGVKPVEVMGMDFEPCESTRVS